MTRDEELARAEYEREQEEAVERYLVYPRSPATAEKLEKWFGYRDSYIIDKSTLRNLVSNYVDSDDDIELYECGEDDLYSGGERIYDILGYVFDED